MSAYADCARARWANAPKEECVEELIRCLASGVKPTKYCEMRIVELLGGHYEERPDQRRRCESCKWMPKDKEAAHKREMERLAVPTPEQWTEIARQGSELADLKRENKRLREALTQVLECDESSEAAIAAHNRVARAAKEKEANDAN